jgi:uncharacterized protein YneF (UPF0154 family)
MILNIIISFICLVFGFFWGCFLMFRWLDKNDSKINFKKSEKLI